LLITVLDVLRVFQKTHEELMNPMDIHRRNAGQRRRQSAKHTNKRANGIGKYANNDIKLKTTPNRR
jgi:hypothetical protein